MKPQPPIPDVMRIITATSFVSSAALVAAFLTFVLAVSGGAR
jgi:hypothetical protein